jgi:hypothetical protein
VGSDIQQELLNAATLLEKAASIMEYSTNLHKEASDTTNMMIQHGMVKEAQRNDYINFLTKNPQKIASMKAVVNDLPAGNVDALGEVSTGSYFGGAMDPLDKAILG